MEKIWSVWCLINGQQSETLVKVCYDSPSNSMEQSQIMYDIISGASNQQCLIMGDFNKKGIDWNNSNIGFISSTLLSLTLDLFLTQHVRIPTREESILDLIFSTEPNMVDNIEIMDNLRAVKSFSDHKILSFELTTYTALCDNNRSFFDFRNGDFLSIKTILKEVNRSNKFLNKNTIEMWDCLKFKLMQLRNKYILKRIKKVRNRPLWMDYKTKNLSNKKYKDWK